jgi:hypothetical protein
MGRPAGISRWPLEPRVDAGVKERNEMTIGRTDDPENLFGAPALEAARVFGFGSRIPSGPAVMMPRRKAGHMIAIDPPVRILTFPLASEGPFSNRASFVNNLFLVFVALPRSWFSPRSKASAATSGSKYGRRNVHSGLA